MGRCQEVVIAFFNSLWFYPQIAQIGTELTGVIVVLVESPGCSLRNGCRFGHQSLVEALILPGMNARAIGVAPDQSGFSHIAQAPFTGRTNSPPIYRGEGIR